MSKLSKIVTHPGQAHRDDFVAVCVLLAAMGDERTLIARAEPTAADLDDPNVAVIDVGGRHEPALMNFDHHQLPRDAAPTCALTMVLQHLGLLEAAKAASPWISFTEVLDSKGPMVAMAQVGCSTQEQFAATMSPVEAQILRLFAALNCPSELLRSLGQQWLDFWQAFAARLASIPGKSQLVELRPGLLVLALHGVDGKDQPTLALEAYCNAMSQNCGKEVKVTITRDDRGPGWSLFRRNDAPGVDFSRLEGKAGVTFAHKGGFVAKTAEMPLEDAIVLVDLAS